MPKFVPVKDPERALHEQRDDEPEMAAHRRFDAPHVWSGERVVENIESGAILRPARGAQAMVRDARGLWVRAKTLQTIETASVGKGEGRGRGRGISVLSTLLVEAGEISAVEETDQRKENDHYEEKPSRDRLNDRRRERDGDSRDRGQRYRDRSRNRDHRSRRDRDEDESYSRYPRDRRRYDEERSRERRRSNSRERRRYSSPIRQSKDSTEDNPKNDKDTVSRSEVCNEVDEVVVKSDEEQGRMTAIQIVNHFHDVFGTSSLANRGMEVAMCFSPDVLILSLRSQAIQLNGREALTHAFSRTSPSSPVVSKRVFVPIGSNASFCLDLHRPRCSPALGDASKEAALLFACHSDLIVKVWGTVDAERLAQDEDMTIARFLTSKLWRRVLEALANEIVSRIATNDQVDAQVATLCKLKKYEELQQRLLDLELINFHNYDKMEVWGLV